MSNRFLALIICSLSLAVSQLPNNRNATASEAIEPVDTAVVLDTSIPPEAGSDPMTVCTEDGCTTVENGPERSIASTPAAQPQQAQSNARARAFGGDGVLFDGDGYLIDRRAAASGECRRPVARAARGVARGVCRVATAPFRLLFRRR